jgi:hypothetical protein
MLNGLKRVKGIEPSCRAWEARVLPLNYTRVGKSPKTSLAGEAPEGKWIGTIVAHLWSAATQNNGLSGGMPLLSDP